MQSWIYWVLFSPIAVQVFFVILKVFGFIGWSWWLVFLPLGIQAGFLGLFVWMLSSIYSGPQ